jgi:hypothetical protein
MYPSVLWADETFECPLSDACQADWSAEFVKDDEFRTDFEDEIFKGACVTHGGQVVNDRVRGMLAPAAA